MDASARDRPSAPALTVLSGRARVAVHRYRLGRLLLAGAMALVAGVTVDRALDRAEQARAQWGDRVDVAVATSELATGAVIGPGDVELRSVPLRLAPVEAVREDPVGRRVTAPTGPGEILVSGRLAAAGESVVARGLPPATRGLVLDQQLVDAEAGAVVDLHSVLGGSLLTTATVVGADVERSELTVAVPVPDVSRVIDALSQGGVVAVVVP